MEFHRGGLDRFEAPGKDFAQGIMDRKRTAVLDHDTAKCCKGPSLSEPEDFQGHLTNEPGSRGAQEISKVWLRQLIIERFVRDRRVKQRIKASVEIGQRLNTLAGTGRRQRQT